MNGDGPTFDFGGRQLVRRLVQRASELTDLTPDEIDGFSTALQPCMARYAIVHVASERGRTARLIGKALNRQEATIWLARKRARQLLATSEIFRKFVEELEVLP